MTTARASRPAAGTARTAAVIGLDLGGTKIAAALVGPDGAVLRRHHRPTPAREGAEAVLDALAAAAREVDGGAAAIGVAAAGVIDPRTGTVTSATDSLTGWAGTALAAGLGERTGLPVACDNDVRATAATELPAPGDAQDSFVYAAIGTGIGGAVAVDGRMLHGSAGIAGHLGHLPSPEAAGLPCTCGGTGHLEVIASGPAMTALYERLSGRRADRLETVAAHASAGEAAAERALTTGARATGRALGGLANVVGPHRVVVGGGVPRVGDRYWSALTDAFRAELMPPLHDLRPVRPRFGPDAAVLGAALLTRTVTLHHPGETR
ncbi:ROK family protein [Streptomyces tubbatahanensis]|uniref:ROK family protein n=1 Tax=Streptomyces tubbatahanensis TaxID=2923272 RepID=A0ABY3XLY4_9ACTN|nr:ROK family protein [Streptomyces tubbatahanensis]UNS95423.1 ROK family protein [Streptomyces tubbatahanensis]